MDGVIDVADRWPILFINAGKGIMINTEKTVLTTCPYCGVGCQINMHVKDGLVYRVDGQFDNLVNRGNLCVKGRFGFDYIYAPDRLTTPMVRRNRHDPFQAENQVSWPAAFDFVADRLGQIRDQHGPDSVAVLVSAKCTNEENYLLQKFGRAVIGTNNIDHCARL
jgi:predicted molibdopterin-dependent oxidoreductase YjgC